MQVDDWKYGDHKFYCKTLSANAAKIKEDGGSKKAVKKYIAHLGNIEEAGQKVMSGKLHHVLIHAVLRDYDEILDCVAVIDLHLRRNTMKLMLLDNFLDEYSKRIPGDASNAKELIENLRSKERLVCAYSTSDACKISFIDKSSAPWGGSWPASKDEMKTKLNNFGGLEMMMDLVQEAPERADAIASMTIVKDDRVLIVMTIPKLPDKNPMLDITKLDISKLDISKLDNNIVKGI